MRPTRRRRRWARRAFLAGIICFLASLGPVLMLRFVDPPTTAFMLARAWETRADVNSELRYQWVELNQISPQLLIALVAAEDQTFPQHHGFDLEAISAVLDESDSAGPSRGASTISQQVAKNLFLWGGRSWLRKGLEAYYTVAIEWLWPKRRILEMYANIAEFGDGVYGAEAAAQYFYGMPAAQLNARQSAALAAVLPNPRRYRVEAPTAYVLSRRAWIERQVVQLGGSSWLAECCQISDPAR